MYLLFIITKNGELRYIDEAYTFIGAYEKVKSYLSDDKNLSKEDFRIIESIILED